jgi:hypothetical protein
MKAFRRGRGEICGAVPAVLINDAFAPCSVWIVCSCCAEAEILL